MPKDELKDMLKQLLKENLSVSIDKDTTDGCYTSIAIYFDDEIICEDTY